MKYVFHYLIPVYDAIVPPNENGSYILLGQRTTTQGQAKGTFEFDCTMLVDVVIRGQGFSFKDSQDAANQICQLINSDANPDCSPNFQVVTTSVLSINSLTGMTNSDLVYRTLIRFAHKIKQVG